MMARNELRKDKLAQRDSMDEEEILKKSKSISEKLLSFEEIERASNIFIYVSFRSEVETHRLIGEMMKRGKRISVPFTQLEDKRLDAVHIEDMERDLAAGYQGILEPTSVRLEEDVTEPLNIDVVIIPGSVFDERGGRYGYGGGYYDRFLEKIPYALRIGLAFDIQTVEEVPLQPHDELLDYVITEKRIIKASRM
ncbi:MAG TPA: 5-formyltetrahydrofolate cyclo-ligase [Desulfopila sp.]|nr:5-formyltetrahydrofolate cyclo-ligase [Desulfopila sp.]